MEDRHYSVFVYPRVCLYFTHLQMIRGNLKDLTRATLL